MPHRKGLVSGIIAGGFGFGSTAFIWLIYSIVNPNNEKATDEIDGVKYFSKDVCDNYPAALRALGIAQAVIGVFSCFLHQRPTEEEIKQVELKQKQKQIQLENHAESDLLNHHHSNTHHQQSHHNITHHDDHHDDHDKIIQTKAHGSNSPTEKSECKNSKNDEKSVQNKQANSNTLNVNHESKPIVYHEFQSFKDALKTRFIYYSTGLALMFTVYGTMTISNYKLYGEEKGYDDSFLSTVGTVGSIFNGISRIFWGSLMERFTIIQIIRVNVAIQIIVSLTYRWVSGIGSLFFIYVVLGYFCYGGWLSALPALITRIYGKKIGTSIYGVTFFGFALASFIQYFLVKDLQKAIGWGNMFFVFTGIQVFAMIVSHIIRFNAVPPQKVVPADIENVQSPQVA